MAVQTRRREGGPEGVDAAEAPSRGFGREATPLDRSSPAVCMMASSGRHTVALAVLVVFVLVAGAGLVGEARPEPVGRSGRGSAVYPAASMVVVTEKARETVGMLMPRLPAGPSNRGAGH
ncbi:hypothetical protein TRIUR3_13508 [Triticum urartu]|uniref:Uncharacterized protein n=1 Tax=Triticum urartu TaxID=4572 RepID=M7Z0I2_TRIUA|nr:hypothetical protein TRIUR3_13508 [Triticum urartu]